MVKISRILAVEEQCEVRHCEEQCKVGHSFGLQFANYFTFIIIYIYCLLKFKGCCKIGYNTLWNIIIGIVISIQFSSVAQSSLTLCDPRDCSMPGFPVHHQLPEFTQIHGHWVSDAIQSSHPLSYPSPPAFNFSWHQDLLKWVSSLHQVAKVLEFQLQHQSLQWTFRTDFL